MGEEFRVLEEHERSMAARIWETIWGPGDSSSGEPGGHRDPWRSEDHIVGCFVDKTVVSCVHLMRRPVNVPDGVRVFGAIAGVATLPEYRGRGYSSRLMRMAQSLMHEDGDDFGLLLTGINPFYEKLGWTTVPRKAFSAEFGALAPPSIEPVEAIPPVEELLPIYTAFNTGRPFTIARTPEYWTGWAGVWFRGLKWILVRENDRVLGYAGFRFEKERLFLSEIGWYPEDEETPKRLAQELAAQAVAGGTGRIYAEVPDEPAFVEPLSAASVKWERLRQDSLMMLPVKQSSAEVAAYAREVSEGRGAFWPCDAF